MDLLIVLVEAVYFTFVSFILVAVVYVTLPLILILVLWTLLGASTSTSCYERRRERHKERLLRARYRVSPIVEHRATRAEALLLPKPQAAE